MRSWWDSGRVGWIAVLVSLAVAAAGCTGGAPAPAPAGPSASAPAATAASTAPGSGSTAASTTAPAPIRARIASTAIAAALAPLWLAQDAGIYERNGLDVEIVNTGPGPLAVQALMGGEVEFAYNTGTSLVAANVAGADLVMLAGGVNTIVFSLVVGPGIERVEDLRGKRLGVTRLGTSTDFAGRQMLLRRGLQPDVDVTMIHMPGVPEVLQGLVAGAMDAGMMSHPALVNAKQQGYRVLLDMGAQGIQYQHTGVMGARRYVEANEEAARRVVKSHVEAIHRFKTDKAAAIDSLSRFTTLTETAILDETWQAYANVYFERVPHVTVAGLQLDVDELALTVPAAAGVRAETMTDNRYVEELVRDGLIQRLYGS